MECELKVREQAVYRSCYCGLCKRLRKEYGWISSCFLTYDCTFLALFLDAFVEDCAGCTRCRCLHGCGTGKREYRNATPALSFAAAVNCVLAREKALDDVYDGGGFKSRAAALLLKRSCKKAKKRYPGLVKAAREYTLSQRRAETEKAGPDACADPTAVFLKSLPSLSGCVPEKEMPASEWLFCHLGRWIYFMDALEDRAEDEKEGRYNVFSGTDCDCAFPLKSAVTECMKALDVLSFKRDEGLLENIIGLGCADKTEKLLQSQGKEAGL